MITLSRISKIAGVYLVTAEICVKQREEVIRRKRSIDIVIPL